MENGFNYYSTFQFWDKNSRRLSVFATEEVDKNGDNSILITTITCSKKDNFSKKEARKLYELGHNREKSIAILIEDNQPKNTFIKYCRNNFYSKKRVFTKLPVTIIKTIKPGDFLGEKL